MAAALAAGRAGASAHPRSRVALRLRGEEPRMFTGIVEELGEVVAVERLPDAARLTVRGPRVTAEACRGDSIAVNGVCLTVTDSSDKTFTADVMAETLRPDRARRAQPRIPGQPGAPGRAGRPARRPPGPGPRRRDGGDPVPHPGRALGRGAHRHPAGPGPVHRAEGLDHRGRGQPDRLGPRQRQAAPAPATAAPAPWFEVSLIPTTLELTTLGRLQPGSQVNLEVDVIAKYVESLLASGPPGTPAGAAAAAAAGTASQDANEQPGARS